MPHDRAEVIRHVLADSATRFDHVRTLFLEYQRAIGIDLSFQGFKEELATLPGKYAPPAGRLVLAMAADKPAGCAALRPLEPGLCEMKRLYVRPPYRAQGLGRRLSGEMITAARQIGYARMRLDTLPAMVEAIALYRSLGFLEVAPYGHNPHPSALYFELRLQ